MAKVEIPPEFNYDPDADEIRARLSEQGQVVRREDLLEHDSLQARRTLEEMELAGEVARFPVGEHILIRDLRDDPDREKPWPHEDHSDAAETERSETVG